MIGVDSVVFAAGPGKRSAHPVRDARSEGDGLSIRYGEGGRAYELRVRLLPDGSLVLRNQAHVTWHRPPQP